MSESFTRLRLRAVALGLLFMASATAAVTPVEDGDADGVPDERDTCPQSPAGAITDAQGCALDGDVDGIADGIDRCPQTRSGVIVNVSGCAKNERTFALATPPPAAPLPVLATTPVVAAPPALPAVPLPQAAVKSSTPAVDQPVPRAKLSAGPAGPAIAGAAVTAPKPAPVVPPVLAPRVAAAPVDKAARAGPLTVPFEPGSAGLTRPARQAFESAFGEMRAELERDSRSSLLVTGHSAVGPDGAQAPRLAYDRAEQVRGLLLEAGIPEHRLQIRVDGATPSRSGAEEQARNCRVEVALQPYGAALAAAAAPRVASASAAAAESPVPTKGPAVAATIDFGAYSAVLDERANLALQEFALAIRESLARDPASQVSLYASVDSAETGLTAARLAERRAATVRAYLVASGVPRNRVEVIREPRRHDAGSGGRRAVLHLPLPAP